MRDRTEFHDVGEEEERSATKRNVNIQSTSNEKPPEISVQELQMLSFRLITESMRIFASYREVGRNKATKILVATRIHGMIIDAIRAHPDIEKLVELTTMLEFVTKHQTELENEFAAIKADRVRYRDRIKNMTAERSS